MGTRPRLTAVLRLFSILPLVTAGIATGEQAFPGYSWTEIGEGIYLHASVNPLAGPVDGNSVVIVTGSEVFVVDTHINPAAARAVIARIKSITDKPVSTVINTHWHDDHTNGNHAYREAFPDARIVARTATLKALRNEWQPMEDGRREAYAQVDVEMLLHAADTQEDPTRAFAYRTYAGHVEALKPELPTLQLVYPDTVFESTLYFKSGGRRIFVEWLGRGNTDGDIIVRLPDDDLLITGDILVAPVPFAFDSPMTDWIATLEKLVAIDAGTIVPGHGAVNRDNTYAAQVLELLRTTLDEVKAAHDRGVAYEDLGSEVDLSELEGRFTAGDPEKSFAWNTYYVAPGLKSAWVSLGYPLPE